MLTAIAHLHVLLIVSVFVGAQLRRIALVTAPARVLRLVVVTMCATAVRQWENVGVVKAIRSTAVVLQSLPAPMVMAVASILTRTARVTAPGAHQ
jgi:hypothetical protein